MSNIISVPDTYNENKIHLFDFSNPREIKYNQQGSNEEGCRFDEWTVRSIFNKNFGYYNELKEAVKKWEDSQKYSFEIIVRSPSTETIYEDIQIGYEGKAVARYEWLHNTISECINEGIEYENFIPIIEIRVFDKSSQDAEYYLIDCCSLSDDHPTIASFVKDIYESIQDEHTRIEILGDRIADHYENLALEEAERRASLRFSF